MKFEYNGFAKSGGIYQIKNTNNNKVYIGSAASFKNRWNQHKKDLIKGKHRNIHLQNAYNLHGADVWEFTVLEVVVAETKEAGKVARQAAEQVWIDKHYGQNCYNIKKKADITREDIPSKDPAVTSAKLSASSKKMWQDPAYVENLMAKRNDPAIRERQMAAVRAWNLDPENYEKQVQVLGENRALAIETRKRKNKERMDAILAANPNHFQDQKAKYRERRRSGYYKKT